MPRTARIKTETGIYHTMIRGINRQIIFDDDTEKKKFLSMVRQFKIELDIEIFAYCIMNNHVHLLIRDSKDALGSFYKKLNTSYAIYYNTKHERYGHLFQDRYKSEAVKDARQLLQTVRYIHMNPVKACICKDPESYPYSSYSEYTFNDPNVICDRSFILELFGGLDSFMAFHNEASEFTCMDIDNVTIRLSDRDAESIVNELYPNIHKSVFQNISREERDKVIFTLIKKHLSFKQISRSTGIGIDVIRKLSAKQKRGPGVSSASEEPSP